MVRFTKMDLKPFLMAKKIADDLGTEVDSFGLRRLQMKQLNLGKYGASKVFRPPEIFLTLSILNTLLKQ